MLRVPIVQTVILCPVNTPDSELNTFLNKILVGLLLNGV